MKQYLFRIIGSFVGLLAGVVGVIFGFIIGWLVDEVWAMRNITFRFEKFIYDPYAEKDTARIIYYSVVALAAAVIQAKGTIHLGQLEYALKIPWSFPARHKSNIVPRRAVSMRRLMERAVELRINIPVISMLLSKQLTQKEIRKMLLQLLHIAAVDPEGIDVSERRVLHIIAKHCGMDVKTIANMERQYYGLHSQYSAVLGVSVNASREEVRKAYRRLSVQLHPDTALSLPQEQQEKLSHAFIRVQDAYEALMTQIDEQEFFIQAH